ncbi:MAG: dTDP-4-dehydrorhamnose reductase [Candidatus Geothermarchaeales archaeon]
MARILVIGGSSLLGQYIVREALARDYEVWATYRGTPCAMPGIHDIWADLTDPSSLQKAFGTAQPNYVILCAALTGVDYCEDHPDEAERVNAEGPAAVAQLCKAMNTRLVHVSTDYVFDGEAGPYDEEDAPRPLSVYGMSKRAGELGVLDRLPSALVVRLCALYGWNRLQNKPNSITWIVAKLRRGEAVPLFADQRVSPTYAANASSAILDLLSLDAHGIFHIAPRDCVSRLELGEIVCEVFDLPLNLLQASTVAQANLRAKRPRHSCLVSRRMEKILNRSVRPLREALAHMRDAE